LPCALMTCAIKRYLFFPAALFLLGGLPAAAQEFEWDAGFDGFLDNREYYSLDLPQTIFGSRIHGAVGTSLEGAHRIMGGVNFLLEFGHEPWIHVPDVTMYYRYRSDHTDFLFGAFPRTGNLQFPVSLLSDTLNYYRPNVQGASFSYRGQWGFEQVFIDWTSRQTETQPETFLFGLTGRVRQGIFFLDHHVLMGHFAGKGIPDPDYHLRDNGGLQAGLGADLTGKTGLDSLSLQLGALLSLDRIRGVDDGWQTPAGFLAEVHAMYRWAGLNGIFYRGQGHTFLYGDPFYRLQQYARLDLFVVPVSTDRVRIRLDVGLHFALGQVDYSQQVLVSVLLGK